nr:protein BEX5 isoform X1 [Macaca nemestrina]
MQRKVAPPTVPPPPSCRTAGVNGIWKSELTVTWALGDPEPMRGLVSPSCSLVVIAGGATASCCPEGKRASCPGKEESGRSRPLRPDRAGNDRLRGPRRGIAAEEGDRDQVWKAGPYCGS